MNDRHIAATRRFLNREHERRDLTPAESELRTILEDHTAAVLERHRRARERQRANVRDIVGIVLVLGLMALAMAVAGCSEDPTAPSEEPYDSVAWNCMPVDSLAVNGQVPVTCT